MNLVIPVMNKEDKKFVVSDELTSESDICLYDTVTRQIQWLDLSGLAMDIRGLVPILKDMDVKGVVCHGVNMPLVQNMSQRGICVYVSKTDDLIETIKQYSQDRLQMVEVEDVSLSSRYANRFHRYKYAVSAV